MIIRMRVPTKSAISTAVKDVKKVLHLSLPQYYYRRTNYYKNKSAVPINLQQEVT
jgi:hypothetical protein